MENPEKSYIRNPITLISLFITTTYSVFVIVMGRCLDILDTVTIRWIVLSAIFVPIVVLLCFCVLLIFWPTHLYGVTEYDNAKQFIFAVTGENSSDMKELSEDLNKKVENSTNNNINSEKKTDKFRFSPDEISDKCLKILGKRYSTFFEKVFTISPIGFRSRIDGIGYTKDGMLAVDISYVKSNYSLRSKRIVEDVNELVKISKNINGISIVEAIVYNESVDIDLIKKEICDKLAKQNVKVDLISEQELFEEI